MTTQVLDQKRAEQFAEKMVDILNGGALALMTSIGHRTGLFDVLAELPPATSGQIAEAAGLNERYVREWLAAMVTGRIIDYDAREATYALPQEHAAALTRASSPNNLAAATQFIPLLAAVEDQIIESFRHGGGVSYSAYPRFHEVMAEESNQTVVAALIDHILPLAPDVVERLSKGIDALDVGCGSGYALIAMARAFPKSRFTGFDFSGEAIGRATAEASRIGLANIRFEAKDVATLNGGSRFGLITAFDAIHDQASPGVVLKAVANALAEDGVFLMQDIAGSSHVDKDMGHPASPYLYTISCLHCMTVSLAQSGAGLGAMWGEETARRMLAEAGFTRLEVKQLPHDIMNNYFIARK
ncbi:MAG TPA: methyltransferase domain-containing protein [Blastocatellia bacterium]|nr:methyltransferase domain-containing protein [Blastocatellia bacterium]